MGYQGFCGKYGVLVMAPLAYGTPAALTIAFNLARYGTMPASEPVAFAFGAGILGFAAASFAHGLADAYLHRIRAGTSEGARIAKKTQAVAYGLTVATAMAFQPALEDNGKESALPETGAKTQNVDGNGARKAQTIQRSVPRLSTPRLN